MHRTADYVRGVRDALDAIHADGGADVLRALQRLGLTIEDIGAPAFARDLQRRRDESDAQRRHFESTMASDYDWRRQG